MKAMEWLNAGAVKVVIGTAAKPEFLRQLPRYLFLHRSWLFSWCWSCSSQRNHHENQRERVVVALDARHGEVVVEGWQTSTGKSAFLFASSNPNAVAF